jgi:hypothetical protein
MPIIPVALNLNTQQQEELQAVGVDPNSLFLARGADIKPGVAIDSYVSSYALLFVSGTESEHIATYRQLFNTASTPEKLLKARNVIAYKTPSAKFAIAENKASLTFDTQQEEELLAVGTTKNGVPAIDKTKIYLAKAAEIKQGLTVDAYLCGHWVLFVMGSEGEHCQTYRSLYGTSDTPIQAAMVREMHVYATPTARFVSDNTLVTVSNPDLTL